MKILSSFFFLVSLAHLSIQSNDDGKNGYGVAVRQSGEQLDSDVLLGHYQGVRLVKTHSDSPNSYFKTNIQNVYVLEHQALEFHGAPDALAWYTQVANLFSDLTQTTILHESKMRFIILMQEEMMERIASSLPRNTAIVSVSDAKITPADHLPENHPLRQRAKDFHVSVAVQKLVDLIDADSMRSHIQYLTGEDPTSNIVTRNSLSPEINKATEWIAQKFESYGCEVERMNYRERYGPNIIW